MDIETQTKLSTMQMKMQQMGMISELLVDFDFLEEYIRQSDHALTFGPIIDPTLWIKGQKSLTDWVELAKILRRCQIELLEYYKKFDLCQI